jgi:hypothetical protein
MYFKTRFSQKIVDHIIPGRGKRFSSPQNVQPSFGAHPASYSVGTGGSFSGIKAAGREVDRAHPSGPVIKYQWIRTTTPDIRLYSLDRDNFIFAFITKCSQFSPLLMFSETSCWCFFCILFNNTVSILTTQCRR